MSDADPARSRYMVLMAMRAVATLMIVAGVVLAFGERQWLEPETQRMLGYGLLLVGFFDLLVVVPMMLRRWKSPTE
jgi:type VI protein secretion system component VasK